MTGEQLYALYTQAHKETNCGVDDWDELTEDDQQVWARIAELVEATPDIGSCTRCETYWASFPR